MAAEIYSGVSGSAKRVERIYAGIDGAPREVSKVYAGVGGTTRLVWSAGSGTLGQMGLGDIVQVREGAGIVDYIIVHKGFLGEAYQTPNNTVFLMRRSWSARIADAPQCDVGFPVPHIGASRLVGRRFCRRIRELCQRPDARRNRAITHRFRAYASILYDFKRQDLHTVPNGTRYKVRPTSRRS